MNLYDSLGTRGVSRSRKTIPKEIQRNSNETRKESKDDTLNYKRITKKLLWINMIPYAVSRSRRTISEEVQRN